MAGIQCPVRDCLAVNSRDAAVYEDGKAYTYLDLDLEVSTLCGLLSDRGIGSGTRISVVAENSFRYVALIFALLRLGCTMVPLNFRFSSGETAGIIREMGVDVLVVEKERENFNIPGLNILSFGDLFSAGGIKSPEEKKPVTLTGKTLILTSGSTGMPKGVLLSVTNHYFSALGANRNIPLSPEDKWSLMLPLFHVGGLAVLFRAFLAGAAVVIPSEQKGRILADLEMLQVTHVSLVQPQLGELLRQLKGSGKKVPGSLKVVLAGGGAVSESLLKESLRLGVPVYKTYGLSEMGSQVTTTAEPVAERNLHTSGALLRYRELSIGPEGKVLVRGKTLFEGYIAEGVFTPVKVDQRGWFDTGDLGYLDENGALVITGRRDNMFISGGENIFPEEIEKEILSIKKISDVVVVPVDHPEFGKRPVAFIRFSSGEGRLSEVIEALKPRLSRFKIPDRFYHFPGPDGVKLKRSRKGLENAAASGDGLEEISD